MPNGQHKVLLAEVQRQALEGLRRDAEASHVERPHLVRPGGRQQPGKIGHAVLVPEQPIERLTTQILRMLEQLVALGRLEPPQLNEVGDNASLDASEGHRQRAGAPSRPKCSVRPSSVVPNQSTGPWMVPSQWALATGLST